MSSKLKIMPGFVYTAVNIMVLLGMLEIGNFNHIMIKTLIGDIRSKDHNGITIHN